MNHRFRKLSKSIRFKGNKHLPQSQNNNQYPKESNRSFLTNLSLSIFTFIIVVISQCQYCKTSEQFDESKRINDSTIAYSQKAIELSNKQFLESKRMNDEMIKLTNRQIESANQSDSLQNENFILQTRPVLFIDGFDFDPIDIGSNFTIKIKNNGIYPAQKIRMETWIDYDTAFFLNRFVKNVTTNVDAYSFSIAPQQPSEFISNFNFTDTNFVYLINRQVLKAFLCGEIVYYYRDRKYKTTFCVAYDTWYSQKFNWRYNDKYNKIY